MRSPGRARGDDTGRIKGWQKSLNKGPEYDSRCEFTLQLVITGLGSGDLMKHDW
jgi:hypothetical protein